MSLPATSEVVVDVLRRPGWQRPLKRSWPAHELGSPLVTLGASVEADSSVDLDGEVEALGSDVIVTGTVTARWRGECRRCLDEVKGETEAELREIFSPSPVEGETWPLRTDHIELAGPVHEAVLLGLPLVPLCSINCVGPDPDRFPTTVESDGEEGLSERAPDPRWAALDDLNFD